MHFGLPTRGQKGSVSELEPFEMGNFDTGHPVQPFTSDNFQLEHPVRCNYQPIWP